MAGHFLVPRCSTAETPPVPEVSRAGLLSLSYSLDEARHEMWLSDAGVCLVRRLLPGAVPAAVAACL